MTPRDHFTQLSDADLAPPVERIADVLVVPIMTDAELKHTAVDMLRRPRDYSWLSIRLMATLQALSTEAGRAMLEGSES